MKCRSCGASDFGEVLNLGAMPLVNNLLRAADEASSRYPLHVKFCRACTLAQLADDAPPSAMFDEYLYFSGQSKTMVEHAAGLVARFVNADDRVLEIASNDGYLLGHAQKCGARVLGVDPARNIAAHANARGIPTQCAYFDARTAKSIRDEWGEADVLFANNVLAHVPDPNEIAAGIATVLAKGGVAHIEAPSLVRMIEQCAFDTIYHEHYSYFSLAALFALFHRHALKIVDVELIDIHGGSFHLQIAHEGDESRAERELAKETALGVGNDAFYAGFAARVKNIERDLRSAMSRFRTIVGYGAAAKSVVLLNAFALGVDQLPWIVDVSPHKQGRFIPGTRQPIVSPERLMHERPEAALLLPWNLRGEIVERNANYLEQGGRFIVPIPCVEVIRSE